MQLTTFSFLSAFIFNSVIASLDIDKQSGFDCGRVFFGRNVIRNAGSLVSQNMKRSPQISFIQGDLMLRGGKPNHVGWPIRESGQIFGSSRSRESFYILVDYSSGRVKDVMARLMNDDFTRCLRKNRRRKSSLLDTSNGYRCGQNFFGDEQLRDDVDEAISKLGQGHKYPSPYQGNLYAENEYLTWPITNEKKDNTSNWEQSPFHVILSRDGRIVDVVAKLMCNNFIKCERATKSLRGRSMKTSLLQRRGLGLPNNYVCDSTVTFKHDYLEMSKVLASTKSPASKNQPILYPKTYNQAPCLPRSCQLWPVFPDGRLYANGKPAGKYFLMMDSGFNIQQVLSQGPSGMVPCRRIPGRNLSPLQRPNAAGPSSGINGVPQTNHRGEFVVRPGERPPFLNPQKFGGQK